MMWFFAILIVLAMGGIAAVASGRGTPLAPEYDDRPDSTVPADRALTGQDVRAVRFSTAWFGYRKSEVDQLLRRLAEEIDAPRRFEPERDTPESH